MAVVRYTYGGRLPNRYREWVPHDTTDRGRLRRFAVRIVVEARLVKHGFKPGTGKQRRKHSADH